MQGEPPTKASTPTGAVFLSYASQDTRSAQRICEALRAASIEVWFDQSELRGGDAWDHKIRDQIHDCRLFIPVISANTESRDEGYFRREWLLAVDRTRDMVHKRTFLVPVVIDGTSERGASVPEKFHELQWTRLPDGETPRAFVDRIKRLLKPEDSPVAAAGATIQPIPVPPVGRSFLSKAVVGGATAIVAILFAYFVADNFWLSKRAAPSSASASVAAGRASPVIPEKSIAVLPFVDMSEKHDQEYFADGMAEEVIDLLAKVPELRVPARTSSFYFKGKQVKIPDIARELAVANVLEGSIRASGNRLRVTAQLIRADTGFHIWSQTYDRDVHDVFSVQDEIANAVVQALQITLMGGPRLDSRAPVDPDAHEAYLKGRYYWNKRTAAGMQKAATYFQQAISSDPAYGAAYSGLADCNSGLAWHGFASPAQALPVAKAAALKAIEIDPQSAEAHASLGLVLHHEWSSEAEGEFRRALQLDPSYANAHHWLGDYLSVHGRHEEALVEARQALGLEPLNLMIGTWVGLRYYLARRYDRAIEQGQSTVELNPSFPAAHLILGEAYLQARRSDRGLAELQNAASLSESNPLYLAQVGVAYASAGRKTEALQVIAQLQTMSGNRYVSPYGLAQIYAALDDKDQTYRWLQAAYDDHAVWMTYLAVDPVFDRLRSDQRFQEMLRRVH